MKEHIAELLVLLVIQVLKFIQEKLQKKKDTTTPIAISKDIRLTFKNFKLKYIKTATKETITLTKK